MKIELRDYQVKALEDARYRIKQGAKSLLIVAPTGAGKTVLASSLMERAQQKNSNSTFVVDRLSLIDQTSAMFDKYELSHGVVQGDHPKWEPQALTQVCSVQTLARRAWPDSVLDVFDEAHILHQAHKARMRQKASIIIGLTATPFNKGLSAWFDGVVNVTTTRALINEGWLAPYRIFSCQEPDMTGVTVRSSGEWDEKETSERALRVVGNVVDEYLKHANGRKFICSAVDTAHVDELARQFIAAGVNVASYTYKDNVADRFDVVSEFRKPTSAIRGLITVTAASRGFDVPDVSCIIMARPLRKSMAEHIQLFGRGLRPSDGKTDCIVLDHSGNAARFYLDTEAFFDRGLEALDEHKHKERQKAHEKEPTFIKCPSCGALHTPRPTCPECGHEYPPRAAPVHVAGSLKELIAGGREAELTRLVWPMVVWYATQRRPNDPVAAKKMALAIYRQMVGQWPTRKFEMTTPVPADTAVANLIRYQNIRWAKGSRA